MPSTPLRTASPRWYLIPARVVLVSFLLTLLSFAVSLLLGILGLALLGRLRGIHPNMTLAYRHVALIAMTAVEVRNYWQSKALAEIARRSR
jgi:hypothetical protein